MPDGLTAVLDETAPADKGGIYYVVAAAVLLDANVARGLLDEVLPRNRVRPFHWAREGRQARLRMLDLIESSGAVAHVVVHYPTGRRRQEQARTAAIAELIPLIVSEGASELIIESRSAREDQRDRRSVLEGLRSVPGDLSYRWDDKTEPLLWVADAVCGAVKEFLLDDEVTHLKRLERRRVVGEIHYRRLPPVTP